MYLSLIYDLSTHEHTCTFLQVHFCVLECILTCSLTIACMLPTAHACITTIIYVTCCFFFQECTGSICIPLGLIQCECPTIEEACDVCCTLGNGSCVSTLRIASDDVNGLASKLPEGKGRNIGVGEACGNFTGYCDFLYNCQLVNSEGALSRLANIVLNQASINNVIDIVSSYWWAILLGGVGTLMLMFFVVVLCHFTLPRPEHMKRRAQKRRERQ